MKFRSRPLFVSGVDADLYVRRPRLEDALLHNARLDRNILVSGVSGSGKTTLLRDLEVKLREQEGIVAWVNPALAGDAADLLELAADAVARATQRGARSSALQKPTIFEGDPEGPTRLLRALDLIPGSPKVTIIIDGIVDVDVAYDVFGRLRDQLWLLEHQWILSTTPERAAGIRTPPADAFWDAIVEVGPMEQDEVREMIERGTDFEEAKIALSNLPIVDIEPRRMIQAVEEYLESPRGEAFDRGLWVPPGFERQEAASRLGRPQAMALAELEALGRPAAAGDEELLHRMGWSRPYLARILAELEDEQILRSFPGQSSGHGRPPKLYEPNPNFAAR